MSSAQKTPFAVSLSNYLGTKLEQNNEGFGWQLPCIVKAVNGSMVTVAFEVDTGGEITFPEVTCPIAQSRYVRLPVQVGDFGMCISANARLGGVTGLGKGLAPLGLPFNLGALVYVPIGNVNWESVDPNAVNINAPNGVVLRDTNNNCTVTLLPSGVTVVIGSTQLIVNASGVTIDGNLQVNGKINSTNDIVAGTISLEHHVHSGVQSGTSNTGTPIP